MRKKKNYSSLDGYFMDEDGEMYDGDGAAIGMKVPTAITKAAVLPKLPDGAAPKLKIGTTAGKDTKLTKSPGSPNNPLLVPLDRAASPQFNALDIDDMDDDELIYALEEAGYNIDDLIAEEEESTLSFARATATPAFEDTENYQMLVQELTDLKYDNQLEKVGKKAEVLEAYLLKAKKSGCPIGDLQVTLDYLLGQDDMQVKQFKAMIEKAPRVQLGTHYAHEEVIDEDTVEQDFNENQADYQMLGVTKKDLMFGQHVRTDSFHRGPR
jgi:hypothetical protein